MSYDFDFLHGHFDVSGVQLRDPFVPERGWDPVLATAAARLLFDGAVSVDELWFPVEERYALSLRLFEPSHRRWTARWFDPAEGALGPAVTGRWDHGHCRLTGPDCRDGRPALAGQRWFDVTESGGCCEQLVSADNGGSWQPHRMLGYTRRPTPITDRRPATSGTDFDFLSGRWLVHHRRAVNPVGHAIGTAPDVIEFEGLHDGVILAGGTVSIDELTLAPGHRGLTFRTYQPHDGTWSIHWVNGDSGLLEPPVVGRFTDGVGCFEGREQLAGHDIRVRFIWSDISATGARWRQWFRVDGGDWDLNWVMTLTRPAVPR